jgi:hypothetical protein
MRGFRALDAFDAVEPEFVDAFLAQRRGATHLGSGGILVAATVS